MKLYAIESGHFKLDGGAMFGVVPKTIWSKTNPADAQNQIDIAARLLLIEEGDRLTLVDTGMGSKQSDKFFGYYSLWGDDTIEKSLKAYGFHPDDITDVFLTHLHFDHVGGAINLTVDGTGYRTAFKNARYWSNRDHWAWATEPNAREKASFLVENIMPIQESGQLHFIEQTGEKLQFLPELGFEVFFADGHTEKQMIPILHYQGNKIAFMADLLPTAGHIPLPYVMGYDTRPLLTIDEKKLFLDQAVTDSMFLFLEHDAHNPIIQLQATEKGPRLDRVLNCSDLF